MKPTPTVFRFQTFQSVGLSIPELTSRVPFIIAFSQMYLIMKLHNLANGAFSLCESVGVKLRISSTADEETQINTFDERFWLREEGYFSFATLVRVRFEGTTEKGESRIK